MNKTVATYNKSESNHRYHIEFGPSEITENDNNCYVNCSHVMYSEKFEHQAYKKETKVVSAPKWYNKNATHVQSNWIKQGEPKIYYRNRLIDGSIIITDKPLIGEE